MPYLYSGLGLRPKETIYNCMQIPKSTKTLTLRVSRSWPAVGAVLAALVGDGGAFRGLGLTRTATQSHLDTAAQLMLQYRAFTGI
eukprot:3598309-Amphidinium_carterae.1